jgi:hypothetical protein
MAVFWDVVLTDASEELTASIMRAMMEAVTSFETSVSIYQTAHCWIPEDINLLLFLRGFPIKILYVTLVSQASRYSFIYA